MFSRKPNKGSKRLTRFSSQCSQYSTFSVKINDLEAFRAATATPARLGLSLWCKDTSAFKRNNSCLREKPGRKQQLLVSGARIWGEIFLELAFHPFEIFGI